LVESKGNARVIKIATFLLFHHLQSGLHISQFAAHHDITQAIPITLNSIGPSTVKKLERKFEIKSDLA
jgi:hypothetical protein